MAKSSRLIEVYEVQDPLLEIKIREGGLVLDETWRHKGDRVLASEFQPATLRERYLQSGSIVLVERLTAEELQARETASSPPEEGAGGTGGGES